MVVCGMPRGMAAATKSRGTRRTQGMIRLQKKNYESTLFGASVWNAIEEQAREGASIIRIRFIAPAGKAMGF